MLRRAYPGEIAVLVVAILTLFSLIPVADAATLTWTGGGSDNLASNPANWTDGVTNRAPGNNDDVLINSTNKACAWDINPSLSSFSITGNYQGKVTLNSNLTMTGDIRIDAGTLDAQSKTITVGGDWIYFSGANFYLGDINGTGYVDGNDVSAIFSMVYNPGAVTYCSDMNFDGEVNIMDVILASRVSRGWNERRECTGGLFKPGTSTVVFNGTDQTIYGDTVFYNLEKIAACPGDTLFFEAGSLQTILGRLTLKGNEGCLLALRSTVDGQPWYIDPQGTRNISFASIKDMNNINFVDVITTNSDNAGGNSPGVKFGGSQCVCLDEMIILARVFCRGGGCHE